MPSRDMYCEGLLRAKMSDFLFICMPKGGSKGVNNLLLFILKVLSLYRSEDEAFPLHLDVHRGSEDERSPLHLDHCVAS